MESKTGGKKYREYFRGKKITVMGLGLLGRGLGDVKFLAECGAKLTVTDLKSATELAPSLQKLKKFKNIEYVLGKHRLEDFRDKDMILKAAGVPLDSPFIAEARRHKIPVEMDESLFAKLAPLVAPPGVTFVGVTGTRGKTTVATLIYEMLRRARQIGRGEKKTSRARQIFLAGNIRGMATLPLLAKIRTGDIVVAELSSWQLQGFGESKISPHIAVFTNFLDDHLNYYRGKRKDYFKDKSYIYANQTKGDFLVASADVLKHIRASRFSPRSLPKSKIIIPKKLPAALRLAMPGEHNRNHAAFALAVGKILKIDKSIAEKTVSNFLGVPGRLKLVKKIGGKIEGKNSRGKSMRSGKSVSEIEIYNDTTSTTPDALVAALESLGGKGGSANKNIVLIMGGTDKGLNMIPAIQKIEKYCKTVILIPGNGTDRVKKDIKNLQIKNKKIEVIEANTLEDAVKIALKQARAGDRIIFSPAFASFGMFKNEYDRGDQFMKILRQI